MVYKIAILFEEVQLSDVVGADLFGNCSTACMDMIRADTANEFAANFPPAVAKQAIDMEFLYVSSTLDPAKSTPDCRIVPTHTYDTCPRDADVYLVGGPMLSHRPEASLRLFRDVFAGKGTKGKKNGDKVVFMTTCVGALWAADAGVLDGKKATTNRMFLGLCNKLHPKVEWVDKRWVVDEMEGGVGEIWTSGGAMCGIDMIAAFIEQKFPFPLSLWSRIGLDVDHKVIGQEYQETPEKLFEKLGSMN